jgi:hypothetical protein
MPYYDSGILRINFYRNFTGILESGGNANISKSTEHAFLYEGAR